MNFKLIDYFKNPNLIINHKHLKKIRHRLNNPILWNIEEKYIKKSCAIGCFTALLPIPFQMILAAILAIYFEANLTLAVLLVWITNPITMPFVFIAQYKIGSYFTSATTIPPQTYSIWLWLTTSSLNILKPFLLGVLITSISGGILSYAVSSLLWKAYNFFYKK